MILLFSMWIENVAYHDDEIEQVAKQFKVVSMSMGKVHCVHFKTEWPT